jgi:hypothetical protein
MGKMRTGNWIVLGLAGFLATVFGLSNINCEGAKNSSRHNPAQRVEDNGLEYILLDTLAKQMDPRVDKKLGNLVAYRPKDGKIDISEMDKVVEVLSPKWCVACAETAPAYIEMFGDKFLNREDRPAMFILKSTGEPGDMTDPYERYYDTLGINSFPTYALSMRDKDGKLRKVYINRSTTDISTGRLERDIDKHLYGIEHSQSFNDPFLTAKYKTLKPVIDALTSEEPPNIELDEDGNPIVYWDLSKHFAIALKYDWNSIGMHSHHLDTLRKKIWQEANKGKESGLRREDVEPLFRKYLPDKANALLKDESQWRKYFAIGGDGPEYPDPTLRDIFGDNANGILFTESDRGRMVVPIPSGEQHESLHRDIRLWQDAFSHMNDHAIPADIKKHWDAYLEQSRKNFDGTADVYHFPDTVSDEFRKAVEKSGIKVEYYSLPSDERLRNLAGENKKYFSDLVSAREERKAHDEKWKNYFLPANTPVKVLEGMASERDISILASGEFGGKWGIALESLVERNKEAISSGKLGVYLLGTQRGYLGATHPPKVGIEDIISQYGLEMGSGASIIDSDLKHLGNLTDWGYLDNFDSKKGLGKDLLTSEY